jgi:hypothetical protein
MKLNTKTCIRGKLPSGENYPSCKKGKLGKSLLSIQYSISGKGKYD